jgi:hypothetical protein
MQPAITHATRACRAAPRCNRSGSRAAAAAAAAPPAAAAPRPTPASLHAALQLHAAAPQRCAAACRRDAAGVVGATAGAGGDNDPERAPVTAADHELVNEILTAGNWDAVQAKARARSAGGLAAASRLLRFSRCERTLRSHCPHTCLTRVARHAPRRWLPSLPPAR